EEPAVSTWPAHWNVDAAAFSSGIDFSSIDLLPNELELIEGWYEETCGEVPRWVGFLAEHRPQLLKVYRNRFEHSVREAMPKQMFPFLQLHFNTLRGFQEGIREAVLMGRGFGMTRDDLLDAILWAWVYGGPAAISIVEEAAGDVLSEMSS